MSKVILTQVSKRYGQTEVVKNLDLDVASGEMVALLGPSGCGKTTTLRMVAGFVQPSAGSIRIGEREVTALPPNRRDVGLVFQNYALFPHLTAAENIAFGLRRRRRPEQEIRASVQSMLAMTRLEGLADRYPRQLSGGQQQRVAVARALVINPAVLLLDEPFSNLDAKLRESTAVELRRMQSDLAITTIFVTHDQQEAMSMADRVAVMDAGRIQQIGTGPELYRRPETRFVADFLGKANFIDVVVDAVDAGFATVDCAGTRQVVAVRRADLKPGRRATLMVRPESVSIGESGGEGVAAQVQGVTFQGSTTTVRLALADGAVLTAECDGAAYARWPAGAHVTCAIDCSNAVLYDEDGAAL